MYRNTGSDSASSDYRNTYSAPRVTTYSLPDCPVQQEYRGHTGQIVAMEDSQPAGQSATLPVQQEYSGHTMEIVAMEDSQAPGQLATLPVQREYSGHTGEIMAMEGSQAAGRLATVSQDHTARIWGDGVEAIHVLQLIRGLPDRHDLDSVAWAPAGDVLATCSWGEDKIHLWSAKSGQLLHSLDHLYVGRLAFSTGGPHLQLASCSYYKRFVTTASKVITWNVETGKQTSNTETAPFGVKSVAWSHWGDMLAVVEVEGTVTIVTL